MSDAPPAARRDGFYGRRKGHALSPLQQDRLGRVLSKLRIDTAVAAPADLAALFVAPVADVVLEIGFGGGEHLIHRARTEPATGRIGVEPFQNGMAKAAAALAVLDPGNVRLHDQDASDLLDWLPPSSLAAIDLLYPDPWPKKRHWKRRFVSPDNLDRIARALKPGGLFRFASDIESYVDWTLLVMRSRRDFAWTARDADDWRRPWAGWPGTRYEAKALREGRHGTYLTFERR